jgi:hypothetical protein
VRSTSRVQTRVAVVCIALSLAAVIAVELLGQGDPLFSPFTTFASGQYQGVETIVVGVVLISASFCVLAPTVPRALLATLSVILLYGGSFVLNTRLFDTYQLDRERHPSTWYFFTVLPLTLAAFGLILGWLIAQRGRRMTWLALLFVAWVPLFYSPLFQIAIVNGFNHPGWQSDALTAFAGAVTEACEFALILFVPLVLAMISAALLNRQGRQSRLPQVDLDTIDAPRWD